MMKRILLGISLLLLTSTVHAQINVDASELDSLVRVIGWFNKTDTLEYHLSLVEAIIENGDTTVIEATSSEFRITVVDSTKNGYVMRYVPTGVWLNDSTSTEGQLLLAAARSSIGNEVLFSTDELGVFKEITNWKEVYKRATAYQQKMIDKAYYEHPELYARQPKQEQLKRIKELTEKTLGTKEKMTEQFVALKLLFSFHGKELPLGEMELNENQLHYYYDVTQGKLEDEEDSTDDEYQIYVELKAEEDEDSHDQYYYSYSYFPDGWPRDVRSTVIEPLEGKKRITQIRIEWISKAW